MLFDHIRQLSPEATSQTRPRGVSGKERSEKGGAELRAVSCSTCGWGKTFHTNVSEQPATHFWPHFSLLANTCHPRGQPAASWLTSDDIRLKSGGGRPKLSLIFCVTGTSASS